MKSEFTSLSLSVNPILAFRILSPCDTYAIRHGFKALAVKVWKHLCGDRDIAASPALMFPNGKKKTRWIAGQLSPRKKMLKAKRKYALICRRQEHFIESHPIAPSGFRPSGQNLTNDPCVDSLPARHMRVWPMRTGITVEMSATDRARLAAIVGNRNSRQKHVWRARNMLLSVRAPSVGADPKFNSQAAPRGVSMCH